MYLFDIKQMSGFRELYFLIILWILIFPFQENHARERNDNTDHIAKYIEFWGILKYHHPAVAGGKTNWDAVFLEYLPKLENAKNTVELNTVLWQMLNYCNDIKKPKNKKFKNKRELIVLNSLTFESGDTILDAKIEKLVHSSVKKQHYLIAPFTNGVMTLINETEPQEDVRQNKAVQLLAFARFWNLMNWFYPYKSLLDSDWNTVLETYIPKIQAKAKAAGYDFIMREFAAKIRDTHLVFKSSMLDSILGYSQPPFFTSIIEGKSVITWLDTNDSTVDEKLEIGDVLFKIDETQVDSLLEYYKKYAQAANKTATDRNLNYYLFNGNRDSVSIEVQKTDMSIRKLVLKNKKGYSSERIYDQSLLPSGNLFKVNDTCLYLNAYQANKEKLREMFVDSSINKIIIDLRNYSYERENYETHKYLLNILAADKNLFSKSYMPLWENPGTFFMQENTLKSYKKSRLNALKKVILVDEFTQSGGEFNCMRFQSLSNPTTIGTQTAGALGDVICLPMPGNIKIYFTRSVVTYPDETYIYPNGVKIDHKVNRSISGIRAGKDEILERA
ncbi:MAG: hypothetical protein WD334_08300, partial [Chitinophagales bacterium]